MIHLMLQGFKKAFETNLFSSQIGCGADGWSMKVYDCLDGVIHSLLTGISKRCLASEKSFRVLDSRCTLIPGNQTLPFCTFSDLSYFFLLFSSLEQTVQSANAAVCKVKQMVSLLMSLHWLSPSNIHLLSIHSMRLETL